MDVSDAFGWLIVVAAVAAVLLAPAALIVYLVRSRRPKAAPAAGQGEREALTLRYIESQPDSGPHKPAMPGHIAVERGIEVVARLPIPDGLAPSHPRQGDLP